MDLKLFMECICKMDFINCGVFAVFKCFVCVCMSMNKDAVAASATQKGEIRVSLNLFSYAFYFA